VHVVKKASCLAVNCTNVMFTVCNDVDVMQAPQCSSPQYGGTSDTASC